MPEIPSAPIKKTATLSRAKIIGLVFAVLIILTLPWIFLGYFSLLVNLLSIIALPIYISRHFDFTIPILGEFLKRGYFGIKFRICLTENDREKLGGKLCFSSRLKLKFYNLSLRVIYYLILLFNGSADSFSVLQEDLRKTYCHLVFVEHKSDNAAVCENLTVDKLVEKIKRGEKIDERVLRKLNDLFYKLHNKKQRQVSVFSLLGLSVLIASTVITGMVTSFIFSRTFPSLAATFNWTQTDWSGGTSALTATHPADQTGWTKYSSSDNNIATSTELTAKLIASSTTQTDDSVSNIGFNLAGKSFSQTQVVNSGSAASVKLSSTGVDFGTGADGAITISANTLLDTTNVATGRSCADGGDAVTYNITSFTSSSTATLSITPAAGCLAANNKVLILNLQGDGTNVTNVGNYEILTIQSVSTNVVTFTANKTKYYGNGASDDTNIGTATTNQRVIFQRIPQYTDVTISTGGSLSASAWNGTKGGVLFFLANGTVTVNSGGSIDMTALGYRGGAPNNVCSGTQRSYQGESYNKLGAQNVNNNLGGGAGGQTTLSCTGSSVGKGGGYGTAGTFSGGGIAYGTADLSKIFFGSAGGGSPSGTYVSPGGNGGGIIYIAAATLTVGGNIFSNGTSTTPTGAGSAGGSIYLASNAMAIGTNLVTASGGINSYAGTNGGDGRIYLKYNSISGSTSPAATTGAATVYSTPGTYTSGVIDTGQNNSNWGNLNWTNSGNASTAITMKARTCSASDCAGAMDWASCSNITSGAALSTGGCATDSHRYVQYQASLSTADTFVTPSLDDVTISYSYYPNNQTLISSAYDSGDATNVVSGPGWTQSASLPAGAGVNIYLRATSSSDLLASTTWSLVASVTAAGFITPGCTNASGAVACDVAVIPAGMKDGVGDRWMQYKIELISNGSATPTVFDINVVYVVNAPPEARNVSASQGSNGAVTVNYQMRDLDTNTGAPANQYKATVTLQYCTANCSSAGNETWTDAVTVSGNVGADLPVAASWSATNTISWIPATDFPNQYNNINFKVRVKINDKESANNLGYGESAIFILDTKAPTLGAQPILVNATTTPSTLTLSATDDSAMTMTIGLNADLFGATPVAYAATSSIGLATDPDTVYVRFTDAYGNATIIRSATIPAKPASVMAQDTSNISTSEFRLFLAWAVASEPFSQYQIYRSTDNSNYILLTTVDVRATNFYVDNTTAQNTLYYYKVAVKDSDGNISYLSPAILAKANGVQDYGEGGGGTAAGPAISNVATSTISTTQATITWDTDILSNSQVLYTTSTGGNFSSAPMIGVATMADTASGLGAHSVTLTGLSPATTYYFSVKSADANNNTSSSTSGANGYSFTTLSGPVISAVATSGVTNTTATITWTTDTAGDSGVFYSTSALLTNPVQISKSDSTTSHAVGLTGLTLGTTYYFYVKSGVATNNNGGNYYSFTTVADTTAPTITNISASPVYDTVAVISWETNESSDSQIQYGLTDALGTTQSAATSTYLHSLSLSGLKASTKYYYKVSSTDAYSNAAISPIGNFTTSETLSTETQVLARETTAKESASRPTGGGVLYVNNPATTIDRTPPIISQIELTDLKSDSALVSWKTDKAGDSIVEYGLTAGYGDLSGQRFSTLSHLVSLKNLAAGSLYNYRVSSVDANGNLAQSANRTFTTPSVLDSVNAEAQKVRDIELLANSQEKDNIILAAAKTAMDIVGQAAKQVSINTLETTLNNQYDFLEKLATSIPAPLLSGEPRVVTTAYTATIAWRTNKEANSLVAYSPENNFKISSSADSFNQIVGDSEAKTTNHVVDINELKPDTTYVYQVRSKSPLGPSARSDNFTFHTRKEALEISSYVVQNISNEKAIFKWVTSVESDARLKYTPYRNNSLAVDETKVKVDKDFSPIHEITVDDFEGGTVYQIELSGKDQKGDSTSKVISTFSTSNDDLPPIIFQVQSSSAINQGKRDTIQTVISWMTNESATSKVYYVKGLGKESEVLSGASQLDLNYTKKHVAVITKMEPGAIYRFMVESSDSTDNVTQSKIYTILTPRQQETVFDVIRKNFSDVFSWTSRVGK